jgi:hypothetical protein
MSQDRAFETDELLIGEAASILTGSADPRSPPLSRPIGSIYLRTNGTLWQKTGSVANQWTQLEAGDGNTGEAYGNDDGGRAASIYGGTTAIDGGGASGT